MSRKDMMKLFQEAVNEIFRDPDTNFLRDGITHDLKVKRGKNDHRTCF